MNEADLSEGVAKLKSQVGPPAPVDDAMLTERGGRLLYALGPTIGNAAIQAALARWRADETGERRVAEDPVSAVLDEA